MQHRVIHEIVCRACWANATAESAHASAGSRVEA